MSWQLASFVVVAVALGAGFAWYERTRPSSRVLALVATLVAMAVLGRLAFAPLPNVKPATTDVILFAGFVLGAAPGFVTGAITALVVKVAAAKHRLELRRPVSPPQSPPDSPLASDFASLYS